MAANVNVLCPNGHRVSVKVTPTTSVLHVIEEVCKKKGFQADNYDIKRWVETWITSREQVSEFSVFLLDHLEGLAFGL